MVTKVRFNILEANLFTNSAEITNKQLGYKHLYFDCSGTKWQLDGILILHIAIYISPKPKLQ
ncbi:MAG: hypothetical protein JWQ28_3219 [Pedobacter sp.]|jgi:hypothetical protein|nr:hypothetical protein [Pedobacter sp.]